MATKVITMIVLPLIYAIFLRVARHLETKEALKWSVCRVLAETVSALSGCAWLFGTFAWVAQGWDSESENVIIPLALCLLMALIVEIICPPGKDECLPKTTDQRLDAVEAKLQGLESEVSQLNSENRKE